MKQPKQPKQPKRPDRATVIATADAFGGLMEALAAVGYLGAVPANLFAPHLLVTGILLREVAPAWCAAVVAVNGGKTIRSEREDTNGKRLTDYLRELTEHFPMPAVGDGGAA